MTFAIKRQDGRSNQQVLIDYVANDPPGTVYQYDDLCKLLGFQDRSRAQQVVGVANHRLLKEQRRALMNVRGEGYRLAEARDHQMLATLRKNRADRQMEKGLHLLSHVRWDEMTEQERLAHQGYMMIMSSLYDNQKAMEARQDRIDAAIEALKRRVDDDDNAANSSVVA